ncbi:alpha/beta hydrolase family protein [Terriglobus roseus]|uniref:Alpha/beta hydrolase family protein n=1 Tax=Terriglobus roseus TaxID=392734 RepID=A0A1G7HGH8_9BACT|nr:alpha/beta fold hydrolase [Terriglobus roseus]SDE99436.1 Alpha/beta hydrolase family protein [Terriglobus roseus]
MRTYLLTGILLSASTLHGQTTSSIAADPPADSQHPSSLVEIAVPSHGAQLLGALYLASGSEPHPTAIIYHGFPGYEQNLDLAQTLRRAGYNVLAVHYRGSWGISGNFSYQHVIEDADAQVQWATSPEVVAKYRIDPKRVVVIGHSLGGYASLSAAAHNPSVVAAVSISGASLGTRFVGLKDEDKEQAVAKASARIDPTDLLPLAGTSATALSGEVFDHRTEWNFLKLTPSLGKRPILLITAADGTGPNSATLLQALKAQGNTASTQVEVKTDHPFSDHRIALQQAILDFLKQSVR